MASDLSKDYAYSSPAKDYIRQEFDRKIIEEFQTRNHPQKSLAYLGLPGKQLLDVLAWREFIGPWTGVQIANTLEDAEEAEELELNVMRHSLERDFHFLRGNIDDFLSAEAGHNKLKLPYHIVNLDYCGGLVHASRDHTSRHIEAIKGLFALQPKESFLLFLTLNLRDKDRGELENYVRGVEEGLLGGGFVNVTERFGAHRKFGNAGLLKIYVPILLGVHAKQHKLTAHAPILYQGSKQMIHFAVECVPFKELAGGRFFSPQEQVDFINLPLLTLDGADDLNQDSLGPKIVPLVDELVPSE